MTNTIKAEPKVRRILLAEDEESIRRSLKIVLRNAGYAVVEVDNGQAALDYLLHNRQRGGAAIDLLMTDIQMSGLTGLDLMDRLKAEGFELPTLVITGYGDKAMVIELLRRGCMDYLDKPLSPDSVIAHVSDVFRKAENAQAERRRMVDEHARDLLRLTNDMVICREEMKALQRQVQSAENAYAELVRPDPEAARVRMCIKNRPLAQLGGDFVDYRNTPAGCDLLVADVAGHDAGASYHTIMLKAFFNENCRAGRDGHSLFHLINRQLFDTPNNERVITALHLRVDLAAGAVETTVAGHPPAILSRLSAPQPVPLVAVGPALGMIEQPEYHSRRFAVGPGDRLFLYTDGLYSTSRFNPQLRKMARLDPAGLDDLILKHFGEDLEQQVEHIWCDALEYCRFQPDDDALLVGVEIPLSPAAEKETSS